MARPVSNPPNPWHTAHVEWIDTPPQADLEIYEERAKSVLAKNDSPDVGFDFSLNPYRGCTHACSYCLSGDTKILMYDGTTRALRDVRVGDEIYGTAPSGNGRRLVRTTVLDHWSTVKRAHRLRLEGGTELVASADHRFLTTRGWKHVVGAESGALQRPHLTLRSHIVAVGKVAETPPLTPSGGLRVESIEELGVDIPMFDITTGTGDFIANGVVSHNCYARPSHQYLDFGAGTDFERKIVVKVNAPEALREEMMRPSWKGDLIAFSGNTDCYQPLEASYELTRRCLEVCAEFRNPVALITKAALVRRDIDVLQDLAKNARCHVNVSLAFADDEMARRVEPGAPSPSVRLKAIRALADAGIPVGVGVAPIIPGLNDGQIAEILERARDAGARRAFRVMLRLPSEVKPVFLGRLREEFPMRADKVENAVREMRGGALYDSRPGIRQVGKGARWDAIESLFDLTCKRLGLNVERDGRGEVPGPEYEEKGTTFRRPGDQLTLF